MHKNRREDAQRVYCWLSQTELGTCAVTTYCMA
jgi:hypothetical protein